MKVKLFASYFVVSVIPLLFFTYIMSDSLEEYFKDVNEKELLYQANKIAGSIQKPDQLGDSLYIFELKKNLEEKSIEEDYRILVFDNKGIVLLDTNNAEEGKIFSVSEVASALDGKDVSTLRPQEKAVYASAYIENDASDKVGAVLLISSFEEVYSLIDDINNKWLVFTIGVSFIIVVVVLFASHIIITPLRRILNTIQTISAGKFEQRVEIRGHDELCELGEAINVMAERLEQVESYRQEFVSNVSHELKTPLSSIKVLSESILLQQDMPTETYREFLQDINSEVDRMTFIINDLLALVKLDHKEAGLNIEDTNLNKLLEDIIKRLLPLAKQKQITVDYENNKNVVAEADEMKLSLAISNLIENAIKYTEDEGSVKVTLDCDHQNVFISVQDTGMGISEEEQAKIFNRFYRVDKTRDRETGGTGLGLAITHSAVMLHNGSIKINSKEGEGATFIVRIPIKYIEE